MSDCHMTIEDSGIQNKTTLRILNISNVDTQTKQEIQQKQKREREELQEQETKINLPQDIPQNLLLILKKINVSKDKIQNTTQLLPVVMHCFMLFEGFVCYVLTGTSNLSGFAPPKKCLPPSQLLPDNWNQNDVIFSFNYQHTRLNQTKDYVLQCAILDSTMMISVALEESNKIVSFEIQIHDYVDNNWDNATDPLVGLKRINELHALFSYRIVTPLFPPTNGSTTNESIKDQRFYPHYPTTPYTPPFNPPSFPVPPGRFPDFREPRGLFDDDLIPGGRSGNLLGPDNPIFGAIRPDQGMFPRFDDFGPPLPDDLNPGTFGRGRGRGNQPNNPFRRPNNDQLNPPGFDNMFF